MSDRAMRQERAWNALRGHRWYAYRGCAPSETVAGMAADEETPAGVWLTPDRESQPERLAREAAARTVCGRCPVVSACLAYALGTVEGGPFEREGMWGGLTATQRRQLLARRRAWLAWTPAVVPGAAGATDAVDAVPAGEGVSAGAGRASAAAGAATVVALVAVPVVEAVASTWQRDTVLAALAAHTGQQDVADAAGMPLRTANWQRTRLVSLYRLDPCTTTRAELLAAAVAHGHLPAGTVIVPDGPVPVAAIPTQQPHLTPRTRRPRRVRARQLPLPGLGPASRYARPVPPAPRARPVRRLRLVHSAPRVERLTLDSPDTALEMAA